MVEAAVLVEVPVMAAAAEAVVTVAEAEVVAMVAVAAMVVEGGMEVAEAVLTLEDSVVEEAAICKVEPTPEMALDLVEVIPTLPELITKQ